MQISRVSHSLGSCPLCRNKKSAFHGHFTYDGDKGTKITESINIRNRNKRDSQGETSARRETKRNGRQEEVFSCCVSVFKRHFHSRVLRESILLRRRKSACFFHVFDRPS